MDTHEAELTQLKEWIAVSDQIGRVDEGPLPNIFMPMNKQPGADPGMVARMVKARFIKAAYGGDGAKYEREVSGLGGESPNVYHFSFWQQILGPLWKAAQASGVLVKQPDGGFWFARQYL